MCAASHPLAAEVAVRLLQDGGNAVDAAIAAAVLLGLRRAADVRPRRRRLRAPEAGRRGAAGRAQRLGPGAGGARRRRRCAPPGTRRCRPHAAAAVTVRARSTPSPGSPPTGAGSGSPRASRRRSPMPRPGCRWRRACAREWRLAAPKLQGAARRFYPRSTARRPSRPALPRRRRRPRCCAGSPATAATPSTRARSPRTWSARCARSAASIRSRTSPPPPAPTSSRSPAATVVTSSPSCRRTAQGATAILMAKILARFDLARLDPLGAARAHLEAEAGKLAYDARDRFLADPDATLRLDHMLADATADAAGGADRRRPGDRRARPRRARWSTATPSISASSTATAWRCR